MNTGFNIRIMDTLPLGVGVFGRWGIGFGQGPVKSGSAKICVLVVSGTSMLSLGVERASRAHGCKPMSLQIHKGDLHPPAGGLEVWFLTLIRLLVGILVILDGIHGLSLLSQRRVAGTQEPC